MEKMRFAELEKNAYAEAEIMDRERDHTHRMEDIFKAELERDEVNRTKKASVSESPLREAHDKQPPEKHTHKKHVHEEEESLIAS